MKKIVTIVVIALFVGSISFIAYSSSNKAQAGNYATVSAVALADSAKKADCKGDKKECCKDKDKKCCADKTADKKECTKSADAKKDCPAAKKTETAKK